MVSIGLERLRHWTLHKKCLSPDSQGLEILEIVNRIVALNVGTYCCHGNRCGWSILRLSLTGPGCADPCISFLFTFWPDFVP